jgi:hypothetical protein
MREFLSGMLMMANATVALFFVRYARTGGDRLFGYFAAAFAVMAVEQIGLIAVDTTRPWRHYVYLVRLLAFLLIIAGIIDKNRRGERA